MNTARAFERCINEGGVAVFPADTVYGLACHPDDAAAVRRLYELKGRDEGKSAAVMFFELDVALAALPELPTKTRSALAGLLPGGVTALLPNPRLRYPLACRADPQTLGLRVVSVPTLAGAEVAVLQSSANLAGGPDARRVSDVPASIRASADLIIDGGELPGTSSTVIDLRHYADDGSWTVVRAGAVSEQDIASALCPGR